MNGSREEPRDLIRPLASGLCTEIKEPLLANKILRRSSEGFVFTTNKILIGKQFELKVFSVF